MKLGYDLTIEQTQKLTMTPELIQAIQILQFNTQELDEFVQEELLQNPVLEFDRNAEERGREEVTRTEELDAKACEKDDFDLREKIKEAEYDDISYKQWEYSREDKVVEHYAFGDPNGKGSIYNVPDDFSRIRFTSSTTGMTPEERSYYVNTLRNFLRSETSTVSGTKESMKKAYTTFMKNHGQNIPSMTQDQYGRLWKAYRENAMADKISHQGYNAFLQLVENSNIYDLNNNELETAIWYLKNSEEDTTIGIINDVLWNSPWIDYEG